MKENNNLFLPIYVNKDRLLDINSILFDGYSEFSEMTLENEGIIIRQQWNRNENF